MSKLERLNARVAKLLTVAVQEVLEVVKETVCEYREKAARTQRENESLKRRLQELQDKITRDAAPSRPETAALMKEKDAQMTEMHRRDFSAAQDLTSDLSQAEKNSSRGHEPEQQVKQEGDSSVESLLERSEKLDGGCKASSEEEETEAAVTLHLSQVASRSDGAESVNSGGECHSGVLPGPNPAVIKTEPEALDCCATSEPQPHQDGGCVDLSFNPSSCNPSEAARPPGFVVLHSNNTLARRHSFARAGRASFDARKSRREHFHQDEAPLCVVCGKTFSRLGNLRIHQRCHTGERPYGCAQCGRRFSQVGDLNKHKRVHTGEKPYYCYQCGKSFSRRENLKRHQKIHIGEALQLQQVWREHQ